MDGWMNNKTHMKRQKRLSEPSICGARQLTRCTRLSGSRACERYARCGSVVTTQPLGGPEGGGSVFFHSNFSSSMRLRTKKGGQRTYRPGRAAGRPCLKASTQHSALSTQHSALSTQHSALSTQHSAPSTQHSALSTQDSRGSGGATMNETTIFRSVEKVVSAHGAFSGRSAEGTGMSIPGAANHGVT